MSFIIFSTIFEQITENMLTCVIITLGDNYERAREKNC